jgi:hypothetical protein
MKYVPIIIPIILALALIGITLYRPYVPNPPPEKAGSISSGRVVMVHYPERVLHR